VIDVQQPAVGKNFDIAFIMYTGHDALTAVLYIKFRAIMKKTRNQAF
jgi:hypothetical protein